MTLDQLTVRQQFHFTTDAATLLKQRGTESGCDFDVLFEVYEINNYGHQCREVLRPVHQIGVSSADEYGVILAADTL